MNTNNLSILLLDQSQVLSSNYCTCIKLLFDPLPHNRRVCRPHSFNYSSNLKILGPVIGLVALLHIMSSISIYFRHGLFWKWLYDVKCLLCSMHTYRLAVGSWRYRQLPTENRRSSVGVYWTPTRSSGLIGAIPPIRNLNRRKSQSALVGRCVPNVNPIVGANRQVCIAFRLDSTVGGKLTNHSYHFRARLDLAAIFASTGID